MVSIIFLSFPLLAWSLSSDYCLKIQCSTDIVDTCIGVSDDLITVGQCKLGYSCSSFSQLSTFSNIWKNETCEADEYTEVKDLCNDVEYDETVIPGYSCCKNSNCITGICTNGLCEGLSLGEPCGSIDVCKAGTWCEYVDGQTGTCVKAKSKNAECSKDRECGIGYGCNQGYCIKLFSLYYSKKSNDKKFCNSNYMTVNGYCDGITVSIDGKSIDEPFECNIGDTCQYNSLIYETEVDSGPCLCSGKNSTKGHCSEYVNIAYDLIDNLYEDLQYDSSNCAENLAHTGNVKTLWECKSISDDEYEHWYYVHEQFTYWGIYQSGVLDSCANNIGLFDPDYDEAGYAVVTALLIWLS